MLQKGLELGSAMTGIYMQEMCIYVTDKGSNCALVGSQLSCSTLQWEAKAAACFQFSQEFQNFLRFYFVVRDIEDFFIDILTAII